MKPITAANLSVVIVECSLKGLLYEREHIFKVKKPSTVDELLHFYLAKKIIEWH